MSNLTVGTASAEEGTIDTGSIKVTNTPSGSDVAIPVLVVNGSGDGPVLWINGCIHGSEPQGPLAIRAMLEELDPNSLNGAFVGVPVMNVPAFDAASRGNPQDPFAYDMNRNYPGDPEGRLTDRIAWAHKEALAETADMEISVHSGGAHSYLETTLFANELSMEMAKAMGPNWDLFLESAHPTGSPMAELFEQGKPAISVEQGGNASMKPQEVARDTDLLAGAFLNVMRHYDRIEGEAKYAKEWRTGEQIAELANYGGLWVPEEDLELHEPMKEGTVVGRIYDLFGNEREKVRAPSDGEIFGIRTQPIVQAGEWVLFYANVTGELE